MRIFTLVCSILLLALGASGYYGWGFDGDGPETLVSAIPGGFGALMLFGNLVALFLRRTGLQIALLAALAGSFSGLGRLTPAHLDGTLEWKAHPANLIVAMTGICFFYLLARVLIPLLPNRLRRSGTSVEGAAETSESIPC